MTAKQRNILKKNYKTYRKTKQSKSSILSRFRSIMPELIFRTTKLEGETVTRKLIRALF